MNDIDESHIERGSGNVFADLGFPDADTHQLKAGLVSNMIEIMREQKLTQSQAGALIGISQPEVSRILKGHFHEVSTERLLRMLTKMGCQVDIQVHPQGRPAFAPIHLDAMPAVERI